MDAHMVSSGWGVGTATRRIHQDLKAIQLLEPAQTVPSRLTRLLGAMALENEHRLQTENRKPQRIGVIGAGVAGLRCADVLLHRGFDVTILEGRNRLGGRLHQERLPNGYLVDTGPNWIHGTKGNPIMDLARLTETSASDWDSTSFLYDENGALFFPDEGLKYSEIMWQIILEAFEHSEKYSANISPDESLFDFFRSKVEDHIREDEEDFARKRNIVLQMAEFWGAFVGSPATRQSLKFFWLEECIGGETKFCADTYRAILEEISRHALSAATIKFNTTVTKLHGKSVSDGTVRVETAGDQVFDFDDVVLTAPLGWLKKNPGVFDPPLPSRLTDAIANISYGCLEKVYISFRQAFWQQPDANGRVLQGFCQWLSPGFALATNPERWTHEVVELASLPPSTAHPTLLFYIYGDQSHHITSTLQTLGTKDKRDEFLYSFFKPYYSRLPHFNEAAFECQPTGCLATSWLHDDLAGNGSYSNFQTGLREGDKDIRIMREGVASEGIWLAGEHTAPFVALGTVTGAYWSGELVGRRIAEAHGLDEITTMSEGVGGRYD